MRAYLKAALEARSMEHLWQMHCDSMAEFGFDRLLYGYTRFPPGGMAALPENTVMLSNHSREYLDVYIGEGLYRGAPAYQWMMMNGGVRSWGETDRLIREGKITPEAMKVIEFNRSMGLVAGYSISFPAAASNARGMIALGARAGLTQDDVERIWDAHGEDIYLMNSLLHLKVLVLPHPARTRLSRRQREVLAWVGEGKTAVETASILGLTPATVEKHLRTAREALGVETTAQAVLRAAFQNQMYMVDGEPDAGEKKGRKRAKGRESLTFPDGS